MTEQVDLYVHIGAGKCGSSAIQQFLDVNADRLRAQHILVPGRDLEAGSPGCSQHLRFFEDGIGRPDFVGQVTERLWKLNEVAQRDGMTSVVLSGENLINPKGFVELFEQAAGEYRIRIVAYVRRQDDFMISAWQQWQLKQHESFWDYYRRVKVNWHRMLEPWRRRYGDDSMRVRRFSSTAMVGGDAVKDFCDVIGADTADLNLTGRANRSLHERFNHLANKHRDVLFDSIHDHRFYTFLEETLGEKAYKNYRGSALLNLAQRRMILEDHAEANERLRATYFPDIEAGTLFPKPTARDVHVIEEPDMDEATELLYIAMFRMWLQNRS